MLSGIAGATLVSVAGVPAAQAREGLSSQERDMAMRVMRAVAQFPIEFPGFGEKAPALARASSARLSRAVHRLTGEHLTAVRAATRRLIADGMGRRPPRELVRALGAYAARDDAAWLAGPVALSVAALAPRHDPNDTGFAGTWLGGLARMHEQGTLGEAVNRRRIG